MEEGDATERTAIGSSGVYITANEPRSKRIVTERDWTAAIRHWSDGVLAFYKDRKVEIDTYIGWIQARARAGNWPDIQIIRFDEKVRKDHAARRTSLLSDTSELFAHQADLLSASQSQVRAGNISSQNLQHRFRSIANPADDTVPFCKDFNARSCKSTACQSGIFATSAKTQLGHITPLDVIYGLGQIAVVLAQVEEGAQTSISEFRTIDMPKYRRHFDWDAYELPTAPSAEATLDLLPLPRPPADLLSPNCLQQRVFVKTLNILRFGLP